MSTGVIRISAALFALALLVGVFGLNTQPTQAQALDVGIKGSRWASVPAALDIHLQWPEGAGAGNVSTGRYKSRRRS